MRRRLPSLRLHSSSVTSSLRCCLFDLQPNPLGLFTRVRRHTSTVPIGHLISSAVTKQTEQRQSREQKEHTASISPPQQQEGDKKEDRSLKGIMLKYGKVGFIVHTVVGTTSLASLWLAIKCVFRSFSYSSSLRNSPLRLQVWSGREALVRSGWRRCNWLD